MPPRILAVEPGHDNGRALKRFVHSCVDAELLVVDSVDAARAAIEPFDPHMLLVSELVPAGDDVTITAHARSGAGGRPLPVLSVPAMAGDRESPAPRGRLRLIASGGTLSDGPRTQLARRQAALREALRAMVTARDAEPAPAPSSVVWRLRAPRTKGANIPWLTRLTMPLGLEVRLVNISRSGLLIESRGQFVVGHPAVFELQGPRRVVVSGHFVRTTATGPQGDEIYRSAAIFDDDLPIFAPPSTQPGSEVVVSDDLHAVLAWVREQARTGLRADRIRAAFELRVQELTGARNVLICRAPTPPDGPGTVVCLPVPASDGSQACLQAVYDTARPPTAGAFEQLTAAAALAADVLEIEHAARAAEPRA